MVVSRGDGSGSTAGAFRVACVELVRDDDAVVRRFDDALAAYADHAGGLGGGDARAVREGPVGAVRLPAGFGSLPPGPLLGAAIPDVPVRRVNGHDTVDVMTAAYRQACHAQAVFLQALLETGMRRPHTPDTVSRLQTPGEFAAEEARAALVWSRRRADSTFEFAWQVHERLPMLGEAMYAGALDEPRARACIQWTMELSDDRAAQIITGLLPVAGGLPVGELIDRIKRAAIAIDPGWAERRYRAAVKGRRVEGSRNDDGTANLHGLDLPVDRAAAACDRIDALARACKHAGDARPIDHVRADLYLGMLDGTFEQLTDDQLIDHVLAQPFTDLMERDPGPGPTDHDTTGHDNTKDDADDGGDADPGGRGRGADGDGGGLGPGRGDSDGAGLGGRGAAGDDKIRSTGEGNTSPGATGNGLSAARPHRRTRPVPADAVPTGSVSAPAAPEPTGPEAGRSVSGGWCVRELRVEVPTVLGLNEHPGEIVGWDFIPATLARSMLASMTGAQWRWVLCDRDGRPIDTGTTRRRPAPPPGAGPPALERSAGRGSSASVELQVKADDLAELIAAGRMLGWDAVLADIRVQHTNSRSDDAAAGVPHRRSARAGLRRIVQIRDRCCTHPACRVPAARTDQDHAIDHAHGGATDEANLGCCCRHDHRLKHDGGWHLHKPAPDVTVWTSPLGRTYTNRPPPIMPAPPEPSPDADPTTPPASGPGLERAATPQAAGILAIPTAPGTPQAPQAQNVPETPPF